MGQSVLVYLARYFIIKCLKWMGYKYQKVWYCMGHLRQNLLRRFGINFLIKVEHLPFYSNLVLAALEMEL